MAQSLNGPWQPLQPNTLPSCNNPAPFVHPNGTLFIVCNGLQLFSAPSVSGPYTLVTNISLTPGMLPEYDNLEDPYLWIDGDSGAFKVCR